MQVMQTSDKLEDTWLFTVNYSNIILPTNT